MKKRAAIVMILSGMLLALQGVPVAGEIKSYKSIAFQGLVHLSKYEIIEGVPMKRKEGAIIIDRGSLKKRLAAMPLVKSYSLSEEKGKLIVTVSEKKPHFTLAVKNRRELVFLEVDAREKILVRGRILGGGRPVIFCQRRDLEGGAFSPRVRRVMKHLAALEKERKKLYGEIESLSFVPGGKLSLTLKGRVTRFIIESSAGGFRSLEIVAGYCDLKRRYPETITIEGSRIVLR